MIEISLHAIIRAKERYKLNKNSFTKLAEKAFKEGRRPKDFRGRFRKYLDKLSIEHNTTPVVFGEYLFFFIGEKLITTYCVESEYKKYLKL